MYVTFDGTEKAWPVYKQQIKTISKDKGWVDVLKPFNMEVSDDKKEEKEQHSNEVFQHEPDLRCTDLVYHGGKQGIKSMARALQDVQHEGR